MPTYEYACKACDKTTEVTASFAEKDKGLRVACPGCGREMSQAFTSMAFIGGKSSSSPSGTPAGGSCGSCSGGNCSSCNN